MLMLVSVLLPDSRLIASEKDPNDAGAVLLVLEDCDSDNKRFGDVVSLLNSKGELVRVVSRNIRIQGEYSGFSISEDGCFFAVCERESNRLVVYETANGREKWSLSGIFNSAVFANNLLYASIPGGIFAINNKGMVVKHVRMDAYDIAFDQAHECFWISGLYVQKCNMDLEPVLTVKRISSRGGPLFVEVNPDGSIWVTQSDIYEKYYKGTQMYKVSPEGKVLKTIDLDFVPKSVRINKSDSSVWTTGIIKERDYSAIGDDWPDTLDELNKLIRIITKTFTRKYDSEGNLIFEINRGGYSIELDQSDGSAWIGDKTNIWHYSANGRQIGSYAGTTGARKWYAVISNKNQSNKPNAK